MPCKHSLDALLAKTDFAKDGEAVRRSKQAFDRYRQDTERFKTQMALDASRQSLNSMLGNVNLVQQQKQPELDVESMTKVSDRGALFDHVRLLCREYAMYSHDHTDVYNAIVSLFGTRTFGPEALPSDALAFVILAAFVITVVDHIELNTNAPEDIREKATIAASIVSVNDNFLKTTKQEIQENTESAQLWRYLYDMLLIGKDKVSAFITDIMWSFMGTLLSIGLSGNATHTYTHSFMEYVAKSRSIPVSSADPLFITARAEIVVNGKTYEAAGYCRDGVLLRKLHDGVDSEVHKVPFSGLFSRLEDHYNAKSDNSVCAGCSLQLETENGRLYKYENSLCSADLTTAQDVKVHIDGSVDFVAETLLIDKRTDKVMRTGMRKHKCDLYDMHVLGGFDTRNCQKLSCLFEVSETAISCDVECNGVSVWATVERMDDYELDESGRVKRIHHGSKTKFPNQDGKRLLWGTAADGSAFTIDDVVE